MAQSQIQHGKNAVTKSRLWRQLIDYYIILLVGLSMTAIEQIITNPHMVLLL